MQQPMNYSGVRAMLTSEPQRHKTDVTCRSRSHLPLGEHPTGHAERQRIRIATVQGGVGDG